VRLWRRARRQHELPAPQRLAEALQTVGYSFMRLDPQGKTVDLTRPGMFIDLGGIATGYAIDEAMNLLRQQGMTRALIDASGDIGLGDPPPDKVGWTVGVGSLDADAPPVELLSLSDRAIVTSGDQVQFVEIGGRRYSHLIDPRTGMALTDHSSVTVVAPDAITADGLASAVSVLGPKDGLALVERTPGAAAFIMRAPQGKVETWQSRRWKELAVARPTRSP
jgi:thiamine biosynthesis lipoprotein